MLSFLRRYMVFIVLLLAGSAVMGQSLSVSSCGAIEKRNNGNGQAARAAGNFPGYGQNNAVAANVVGTSYQNVPYDPSTKTGSVNFRWTSATAIVNLPVITRVWVTASGATSGTLSAIKFGPPPPPVIVGQNYYVEYAFYGQNMPPAGKVTLEFSDPVTGRAAFRCTYDGSSNSSAPEPVIDCSPTVTTQPSNQTLCGATTATFTAAADGATTVQWQVSSNNSSWSNVSNGGDYTGATSNTLTISNPTTYDGKYYRAVFAGNSGCNATNSNSAILIAKPKPNAQFASANYCGTGSKSLGVTLTGSAPWSITYSTSGGGSTTVSNITSSPFFFAVSPSSSTTYTLTSVSDAYCVNNGITGTNATTVSPLPTVTITNAGSNVISCFNSGTASLTYTSTNSPNQYSITTGTRVMPSFSAVSNAALPGGTIPITIPAATAVGTYDFMLTVRNSATGCVTANVPFTIQVKALPFVSITAASNSVCTGPTGVVLTAAGASTYVWNASADLSATNTAVVTAAPSTAGAKSYTVTGTESGCSNTATVNITALASPSLSINPSSASICSGSATTLTASGGNTYSWSPSTGLSATTGAVVSASPLSSQTYTVTSQAANGCSATQTVAVTVGALTVGVTGSQTICQGASATLTATGATSYVWTANGAVVNSTASFSVTPTTTTTYSVVGTTGGCSGTASTTVTVTALPVNAATSALPNTYICSPGNTATINLPINTTTPMTSIAWSWSTTGAGAYTASTTAPAGATLTVTNPTSSSSNLAISGYKTNGQGYDGPGFYRATIGVGTCSFVYDIAVTKFPGATPAITATRSTICTGETTILNAGGVNAGTYQWQSAPTVGGAYTNISGATGQTYTTPALSTNSFYKVVQSVTGCTAKTSAAFTVTVNSAGSNTISSAASVCSDGVSAVAINASTMSGATYQWQSSPNNTTFTDIIGATSEDYTLPQTTVSAITYFRRVATPSGCSSSNSTSVTVYPPISNNQITNGTTSFCGTASATLLSATAPSGGSGAFTYQWQSSTDGSAFNNIAGATSATYTTLSQTQTMWYRRIVSSAASGCTANTSPSFVITRYATPTIGVTASATQCAGISKTLTATGGVSYTWSPANDLSATVGASVTATPTITRTYTVTGTDANGCTGTAQTTITVNATPATPTLNQSSLTICSTGGTVNLTTKVATGTGVQ